MPTTPMAGLTIAQAEAQLSAYLAAESQVLSGQTVEFNGRRLTRANLAEIQAGITTWNQRVRELSASTSRGGRSRSICPRF